MIRGAGEFAFAPRGADHAYTNFTEAEARVLIVCTPAGFERHFARVAAQERGVEVPTWALEPTPQVTFVGPTIGEAAASTDEFRGHPRS